MKDLGKIFYLFSITISLAFGLLATPAYPLEQRTEPGTPPARVAVQRPDLIATISPVFPPQFFTVSNRGKAAAGPSVLKIDCLNPSTQGLGGRCLSMYIGEGRFPLWKTVPALAPGQSHVLRLQPSDWAGVGGGEHTFYATADAKQQIAEGNEANNTAKARWELR